MESYKSWSGLNKQLSDSLCDELGERISYFLTRYHDAHNSYGRAAIRFDGRELATFSWIENRNQERDISELYKADRGKTFDELRAQMKDEWDAKCTRSEMDFLDAALKFRGMAIGEALKSENYIIKIFAVMDRRVGKRTLAQLEKTGEYKQYPNWVRQFYELRMNSVIQKEGEI